MRDTQQPIEANGHHVQVIQVIEANGHHPHAIQANGQPQLFTKPIPIPQFSAPEMDEIETNQTQIISLETNDKISDDDIAGSGIHERRTTIEVEGSILGQNESLGAILWLIYTALYWTALTWIPIAVQQDFLANLWGLIIWCFGFMGMFSTAYMIKLGHYPSGATRENKFEINGMGRWTAAILTSTVIIDCFVLVYISIAVDLGDTIDIQYNTNLSRLVLHIIHIFWSSLFFYNRFRTFHPRMAIRAFVLKWTDIIWSCIVSFIITQPLSVDITYFLIVGIALIGWMGPMMFNKRWGTRRYAESVAVHLLILDLVTDAPVIFVLLITQSYKNEIILWIDIIWKSLLLERSWSGYFVKRYLRIFAAADKKEDSDNVVDDERKIVESSTVYGISFEAITIIWIIFVALYWNICVLCRLIIDNEISLNYEYYTWFLGMIGILCMFDVFVAGFSAETKCGKPFIAFTCLIISLDCILHAYELLSHIDDKDDIVGELQMIFHCIALISSILFYSNSFSKGVAYSFVVQWIDIILMFIVIEILNSSLLGDCFSKALCVGYFVVFTIKIIFWFTPMIFGYASDTGEAIHIHMILLNAATDLPLIIIIFATNGYEVSAFLFVDIAFKLIVLLISFAYHGLINIVLARCMKTHNDKNDDE